MTRPATARTTAIQWVVVIFGLGLVGYLARAGVKREDFDLTYVALVTLGLVGLVVPKADKNKDADDDAG